MPSPLYISSVKHCDQVEKLGTNLRDVSCRGTCTSNTLASQLEGLWLLPFAGSSSAKSMYSQALIFSKRHQGVAGRSSPIETNDPETSCSSWLLLPTCWVVRNTGRTESCWRLLLLVLMAPCSLNCWTWLSSNCC